MVNTRTTREEKEVKDTMEKNSRNERVCLSGKLILRHLDKVLKKTIESTPMPSAEEQKAKRIEFSLESNRNEVTGNTSETETKNTSFTERLTAMVGMRPKDKEEKTVGTTKSKTNGIVSAITTEADDVGELNTRTVGE